MLYHSPPAIVMRIEIPKDGIVPLTEKLRREYAKLYSTQAVKPGFLPSINSQIDKIKLGRPRYRKVSARTGIPWFVIGIIHCLESDCNFSRHLHNGDLLTSRTKNVPSGRPVGGYPPFTWEESAIDALRYDGFDVWNEWRAVGILFKLEAYNGFGYRNHGTPSPYLWGGTTFYSKGKYIHDGIWGPEAVSAQIGAAPILKRMVQRGVIKLPKVEGD